MLFVCNWVGLNDTKMERVCKLTNRQVYFVNGSFIITGSVFDM